MKRFTAFCLHIHSVSNQLPHIYECIGGLKIEYDIEAIVDE